MGLRVTGVDETKAEVAEAARRARDLAPFLAGEAPLVDELVAASFASRTSPGGEAWAPTEGPSTASDILPTVDLLVDRQRFRFSVTHPASHYFAFGTSRQPPRNFLPFDRTGTEIMSGAAGGFWRGHAERLGRYLGEVQS